MTAHPPSDENTIRGYHPPCSTEDLRVLQGSFCVRCKTTTGQEMQDADKLLATGPHGESAIRHVSECHQCRECGCAEPNQPEGRQPAQAADQAAMPTPHGPLPQRAAIQLNGRSKRAPATARLFVKETATAWQVPRPHVNDLVQVVSELTTNTVDHTSSETVTIAVILDNRAVTVSVIDQGPYQPLRTSTPDDQSEHGRGLGIVAHLSESWGHARLGSGTRVWARLMLSSSTADSHQSHPGATA